MLYQNLIHQQLQGLGNFNSSGGLGGQALPNTNGGGASSIPNGSFDLLNLPQMQMGGLP